MAAERKVDDVSCDIGPSDKIQKDAKILALQDRIQRLVIEKDVTLNENSRLVGEVQQLSAIVSRGVIKREDVC